MNTMNIFMCLTCFCYFSLLVVKSYTTTYTNMMADSTIVVDFKRGMNEWTKKEKHIKLTSSYATCDTHVATIKSSAAFAIANELFCVGVKYDKIRVHECESLIKPSCCLRLIVGFSASSSRRKKIEKLKFKASLFWL